MLLIKWMNSRLDDIKENKLEDSIVKITEV